MDALAQRQNAKGFVERWKAEEGNEDQQSQSFWIEFLQDVLGIPNPTYVLNFEKKVRDGNTLRKIDVFYEDMGILVEQKSRGVDLDEKSVRSQRVGEETPYQQAKWYADNLPHSIKPRWIITCNFDAFRIYDLDQDSPEETYITVTLDELPEQLQLFSFFTNQSNSRLVKEKELSVQAGEIVGKLYNALSQQYQNIETDKREQNSLNVLIVRFVFLLYAEDAGILQERNAFLNYLRKVPPEDMRTALSELFDVLNTPEEDRDPYLKEDLNAFPYVNGDLFSKVDLVIPQFTEQIKHDLLFEASQEFDWSGVSPTIFGAVFESTLNPDTRREGGMHYTSIENIHKVIDPLFLDDLRNELVEIEGVKTLRTKEQRLKLFQNKLASLKIFDPACGSGNFLTESYLCLRKLENRVLEQIKFDSTRGVSSNQAAIGFEGINNPIKVSIDQFYGIEINDFAVAVAKTAMWIAEEQMLDATMEIVAVPVDFLPLTSYENIHLDNALRTDWNDILPASECSYIIGNPPFNGARWQSKEQKAEIIEVFHGSKNCGNIDYVAGWYMKAAEYMKDYFIRAAFVSTNSICQGEQVANIWKAIFDLGFHIDFAYDTFRWSNEATDQAHVFVVIVGFSKQKTKPMLFHHENPNADSIQLSPSNINAYLADAPDVFVWSRSKPICDVPKIGIGSQPIDDGNYLFTEDEMNDFIRKEPKSVKYFHPWLGSQEFIKNKPRYVLWLGEASESDLLELPLCSERVQRVKEYREGSSRAQTQKAANTPNHFGTEIIATENSVIIPEVSSERRHYIPIGFISPDVFCSNKVRLLPDANLYQFGILTSQFHNAWMRVVAGRLKSDYNYSNGVVYNNFIWPNPTPEQKQNIEQLAQRILDARASYPNASLADLYDPDKMPSDLLEAHHALDKAVEESYGVDFDGDEEKIVSHLFKLYAEAVNDGM